jgi:hypothetical protein
MDESNTMAYQQQVMMPQQEEWMRSSKPTLVTGKDIEKMDEVQMVQPVYDPLNFPQEEHHH